MIDRISGTLLHVGLEASVIDLHGLGVRVETPVSVAQQLGRPGDQVTLLTQLVIPGNDPTPRLFGFLTEEGRELFRLLQSVAGIGPSSALRIAGSQPTPGEVAVAIAREDAKAIKVKGVGPKLAKRVIAELKDKVEGLAPVAAPLVAAAPGELAAGTSDPLSEALRALRSLEFDPAEARRLLAEARARLEGEPTADALVRAVLMAV
jgi:Holliday junction DNA helicase RuvA